MEQPCTLGLDSSSQKKKKEKITVLFLFWVIRKTPRKKKVIGLLGKYCTWRENNLNLGGRDDLKNDGDGGKLEREGKKKEFWGLTRI